MAKEIKSPAEMKKRTMRVYRLLSLIFFLLCIAAPVGVLVFSFSTISSVEELADGDTILNGKNSKYESPCSDAAILSQHRPVRFAFSNESDAFVCTWPIVNTALRLVLAFAGIALVIVSFVFTFPRRGPLLYLFATLVALAGIGFGYIGYDDSSRIYTSNKWCSDGLNDMPWTKTPTHTVDCRYSPFILVSVMDFVSALVCILLAVFSICFVCRAGPAVPGRKKKQSLLSEDNSQDEEEEHNDPFEKLAHKEGKDPRDRFGEPDESEPKPKQKSGGFFSRFGGGGKKKAPEPDTTDGSVNFEKESASRFAPMSKTDREAKDKPLGSVDSAPSGGNVGNALFNFDDVPSSESSQKSNQAAQEPKAEPAPQQQQQQPKAQPKPEAKPQQSGGMVDFESLSGGVDDNPFA